MESFQHQTSRGRPCRQPNPVGCMTSINCMEDCGKLGSPTRLMIVIKCYKIYYNDLGAKSFIDNEC